MCFSAILEFLRIHFKKSCSLKPIIAIPPALKEVYVLKVCYHFRTSLFNYKYIILNIFTNLLVLRRKAFYFKRFPLLPILFINSSLFTHPFFWGTPWDLCSVSSSMVFNWLPLLPPLVICIVHLWASWPFVHTSDVLLYYRSFSPTLHYGISTSTTKSP